MSEPRRRLPWEAIGAIAAVVGLLWAFFTYVVPHDAPSASDTDTRPSADSPTSPGTGERTIAHTPSTESGPDTEASPVPGAGSASTSSGTGAVALPPATTLKPVSPPQPSIRNVNVIPRMGNGILTKVGVDTYELPSYPSSINPPLMTLDWSAQGPGGEVSSSDCTVTIEIDGPGPHYPQSQRSSDCSGSPNKRFAVYDPGQYAVSVTVTASDGASAQGSGSFALVPQGG